MKRTFCLLVFVGIFLALNGTQAGQNNPCPGSPGDTNPPAELVMPAGEFNSQSADAALAYLERTLPGLIDQAETIDQVVHNEQYTIGFPNAVLKLRGYLLRLEYENARLVLETARGKQKASASLEKQFIAARKAWCEFLAHRAVLTD